MTKYKTKYVDLNHYFDKKDNKQTDLSEITTIKEIFEQYLTLGDKIDNNKIGRISSKSKWFG